MIISQSKAISNPPPRVSPSTTEIIGFFIVKNVFSKVAVIGESVLASGVKKILLRSAPTQNTLECLLLMRISLTSELESKYVSMRANY